MTRSEFVLAWFKTGEDEKNCFYCGKPFINQKNRTLTKEHLLPKCLYPVSKFQFNIVHACFGCNNTKNGNTMEEWRLIFFKREGSEVFHCEKLLGVKFPNDTSQDGGNGSYRSPLREVLLDLVEVSYNRLLAIARNLEKPRRMQ